MKNAFTCFVLFFCCIFILQTAHAQQLIVNWTKFLGCSEGGAEQGNTSINDCITTNDGGFIVTGFTNCNNSGDFPTFLPKYQNLFVAKLNASYQLSWIREYGGSGTELGYRICETNNGGYVIAGWSDSGDGDITDHKGSSDIWLLKIDASGNKIWSKTYGSSSASEDPSSIAATPDGGIIVLGVSNGYGDDVPSHYGSSPFLNDWFVLKVDANGTKQWAKSLGGSKDDIEYGALLSVDTSYYLFASSESKDHECTDNNWNPGVATDFDGYIIKLDQSGNVVWSKVYGGSDADDFYSAIFDDRDSTFVIAGSSSSNDYYAMGNHSKNHDDFWVVKTDINGNIKWSKMLGGQGDERWPTIIKGSNKGYVLCGYTFPGNIGSGSDSWLLVLDSAGSVLKDKIFGGLKPETPNVVVPYEEGFLVCGRTQSDSFSEGINSSRWPYGQQAFISKIEYFPVSVSATRSVESLAVYPNPTDGNITITLPQKKRGVIKIFDDGGRLTYTQQAGKKTEVITIDTGRWANGTYMVVFDTGDGNLYRTRITKN